MITTSENILTFYSQPGPMTDAKEHARLFQDLPTDPALLVPIVQKLAVHIFWAEQYGLKLSPERQSEVSLRQVAEKLPRLLELDPSPLLEPRPVERRLVCNCRDFSTLYVAILRSKGVPARARCGFGTYFMPGHFEDHWVVEYWKAAENRWVMLDAQLDELQRQALGIQFDVLDMPKGQFVLAGDAWQMCKRGEANPDDFGIFEWHGWDFIRGNICREVLSLNKIEVLPWDDWGMTTKATADYSAEEMALLERAAELTAQSDPQIIDFYRQNAQFHAPEEWIR